MTPSRDRMKPYLRAISNPLPSSNTASDEDDDLAVAWASGLRVYADGMTPPARLFAGLWLARLFALLASHATWGWGWGVIFAVAACLSFFPLEAWALVRRAKDRDMYSELVTWVLRRLSRHTRPNQGWNLLATIIATLEASVVWRLGWHFNVPWVFLAATCLALVVLLRHHWVEPHIHG